MPTPRTRKPIVCFICGVSATCSCRFHLATIDWKHRTGLCKRHAASKTAAPINPKEALPTAAPVHSEKDSEKNQARKD